MENACGPTPTQILFFSKFARDFLHHAEPWMSGMTRRPLPCRSTELRRRDLRIVSVIPAMRCGGIPSLQLQRLQYPPEHSIVSDSCAYMCDRCSKLFDNSESGCSTHTACLNIQPKRLRAVVRRHDQRSRPLAHILVPRLMTRMRQTLS
jgi:hypothetical protein